MITIYQWLYIIENKANGGDGYFLPTPTKAREWYEQKATAQQKEED